MRYKDYINEHYIFEKVYSVKTLSKTIASYFKMPISTDPAEVFSKMGSIESVVSTFLKKGDTFKAEIDVIDPDTGEVFVEKGQSFSGSDVALTKKKYKQQNRNFRRADKKNRPSTMPLYRTAKGIDDFENFYTIEYESLGNIYDPKEVEFSEHDYDFDTSVPVKLSRSDMYTMDQDDKKNMQKLITMLKKSHKSLDFAGEMAMGGKFYTIDVYLK